MYVVVMENGTDCAGTVSWYGPPVEERTASPAPFGYWQFTGLVPFHSFAARYIFPYVLAKFAVAFMPPILFAVQITLPSAAGASHEKELPEMFVEIVFVGGWMLKRPNIPSSSWCWKKFCEVHARFGSGFPAFAIQSPFGVS